MAIFFSFWDESADCFLELLPLLLLVEEAVSSLDFVAGDATPGLEEFAAPAEPPRAFEDSSKFGVGEGVTMFVEA